MFWILLNDDANKRRLTHGNSEFIFDTPNLHNHQLSTERLTWYWWHTDLRSSDGWWRWNNFYFHCNNNFYLNRKHSMKVWTKAKKKYYNFFHCVNYAFQYFLLQSVNENYAWFFLLSSPPPLPLPLHKWNLMCIQLFLAIFFCDDKNEWWSYAKRKRRKKTWINNQFGISCQNKQTDMT